MNHLTVFRLYFVLFFLISSVSFSQTCDSCPKPDIYYYDADVLVPKPFADPDSLSTWKNLFWPSLIARKFLRENDPDKNCITVHECGYPEDTLGTYYYILNTPPAGLAPGDYILWGSVNGSGSSYLFSLFLESARTREIVASASNYFSPFYESALLAGEATAEQLMSLISKIRNWEINKRENDVSVALLDNSLPEQIKVKLEKSEVDTSETINVEFTLTDCDGVPLPNRMLYFHDISVTMNGNSFTLFGTQGGKVTPDSALTDNLGKVNALFKATYLPGTAFVAAAYPHYTPSGKEFISQGVNIVQIESPGSTYWLLDASLSQSVKTHYDTVISSDFISWVHEYSGWTNYEGNGRIRAIIENNDMDPVNNFSFSTDAGEPISISVSGSCSFTSYEKEREVIDGKLYYFTNGGENSTGYGQSNNYIQIDYSEMYKGFAAGVYLKGAGSSSGVTFSSGTWGGYNYNYEDMSFGVDASGSTDAGNCTFKKDTLGYSISGSYEIHNEGLTFKGTEYTDEEYNFRANLIPYNTYTGMDDEVLNDLFPSDFSIEQNYPNPFNPSTNIVFRVKEKEYITIKVYNLLGSEVAVLANDFFLRGTHTITWNSVGLPSGVYFYQLTAGDFVQTRKMILLK